MSAAGFSHHVMAPRDLTRAAERAAPHLRPILCAVAQGFVGFGHIAQHGGRFSFPTTRPIVLIIGDDYDLSFGPPAFHRKSLRRFLQSAGSAVIVSGAAEPFAYAAAVASAVATGLSAAVIETREPHEPAWIALVREAHPGITLLISTPGRNAEAVH